MHQPRLTRSFSIYILEVISLLYFPKNSSEEQNLIANKMNSNLYHSGKNKINTSVYIQYQGVTVVNFPNLKHIKFEPSIRYFYSLIQDIFRSLVAFFKKNCVILIATTFLNKTIAYVIFFANYFTKKYDYKIKIDI